MTQQLNQRGIVVNPGTHVPVIERKIQEVKQRARGIINNLASKQACCMFDCSSYHVCGIKNQSCPTHKSGLLNLSPAEAFIGRVDFKRDLSLGFGEYAEAMDPYANNTMRPKTQSVIALGSTGSASGSVKILFMLTKRRIIRDQFTVLLIPDNIIDNMNNLSD